MSEMIDEVLVDHIPDVAPSLPLERVQFMLDKYLDKDVYIECKGCSPYLIVRTAPSKYSFFGSASDSKYHDNGHCSDADWGSFVRRSYKIIRDTGALPYAHRS